MRKIKFRVWDKITPSMIPFTDIDIRFMNGELEVNYWSEEAYEGGGDIHEREICETINSPVLMQYIELQDKNGKDIYEGDIVKEKKYIGGNNIEYLYTKFEVIFQGCSFQYKPLKGDAIYTINPIGCEVEVIGNIYENPEL